MLCTAGAACDMPAFLICRGPHSAIETPTATFEWSERSSRKLQGFDRSFDRSRQCRLGNFPPCASLGLPMCICWTTSIM